MKTDGNEHVINLTKFKVTPELAGFGVRDLTSWKDFQEIRGLLFYPDPPTQKQIDQRVERLTAIALREAKKTGSTQVLVSCPPWMMSPLCKELLYLNMQPVVSFTKSTNDKGMTVISLVNAA